MPVTDNIADFITRIRNAGAAGHKTVETPCSNLKLAIAEILKDNGYIAEYEKIEDGIQGVIKVTLKYFNKQHVIKELIRISKPGRRVYVPSDKLPRVRNGLGTAVISTSRGVMSDKQARKNNIGGEVLLTVW
jgi:small subunit ribosomal protein S8